MSSLTTSQIVSLMIQALNLPSDYSGEITLHFGQKMGLRNPQIQDKLLKKELVPALVALSKPVMFEPGDGGKVKLYMLEGFLNCLIPIDKRSEEIQAYRNRVTRWNSYIQNTNMPVIELRKSLNNFKRFWDYSVDSRSYKSLDAFTNGFVRLKSRPIKFIG